MGDERSAAEKVHSEIQGIEKTWPLIQKALWSLIKKHPFLAIGLMLIGVLLGYDYFFGLRKENQKLKEENASVTRQVQDRDAVVKEVKRERDKAQSELAPWVLLAKSTFSNSPPDKRLDLLLEKVEPLTKVLERIDALTNSPQPNLELWADGLLLTNGVYKLPVDSNGVGLINFVVKNSGGIVADNVVLFVHSLTNIQLQGLGWNATPGISGEAPHTSVITEQPRSINPGDGLLVSTLRISNDGVLGPFEQLTVIVSSSRSRKHFQLTCLAFPGNGKLTPATFTIQTNWLSVVPDGFRQ